MHSEATTTQNVNGAQTLYDRFASLYDLTFKFNRYSRSIERYLRDNPLPLSNGARVLDAGCGTGLLTLALLRVLDRPARITAIDLSVSSLKTAERAVTETRAPRKHQVSFAQANLLALPFADETFELIVTSGALEYVSLREGLGELSRVLAPGGYLFHLPVRPSPFSRLLEVIFRFKTHPPREVEDSTTHYFRILDHHRFPPLEPIGWTKSALLAQKQS
ncbi:MAG TPA: class I SAM-dependent methyltransferase [Pyrinomonadaceae bacterium]|jgi:ubiquinone/menaquinone biosynthesis C-methylase UbiE|nr:class I SAM-dependent methyltransferase [Pyrinomonadaceae bacterium]